MNVIILTVLLASVAALQSGVYQYADQTIRLIVNERSVYAMVHIL